MRDTHAEFFHPRSESVIWDGCISISLHPKQVWRYESGYGRMKLVYRQITLWLKPEECEKYFLKTDS